MKKDLIHIGSRELVSFPEANIASVPAKVDTGADYSSVWASDIQEKDGELSFVLFAPGSRFYNGHRISTKDYKLTFVRNSFGERQQRYKVKLLIKVRSKKVRVEFTLAHRGNNRYPILIGKKTLRGKFVVDVTRDGVLKGKRRLKVLVMNSKDSARIRSLFADMYKLDCEFATYDDIGFEILDNKPVCRVLSSNTDIAEYDLIYFKTYFAHAEIAAAMAEVATFAGVPFIDNEVFTYHARTKLTQYVKLARFDIAVPDSVVLPPHYLAKSYKMLRAKLGEVFIMKDIAGEKGETNYLVRSESEFKDVARQAKSENITFVSQYFVESDGDYRIVVFNKAIELIIKRTAATASTHLTNTSKGGDAELIKVSDFDSGASAIAVRAATTMNRQVAGVDLVYDKNRKKWFVFEVNNSPQLASGSYLEEKRNILQRFLVEYAKK